MLQANILPTWNEFGVGLANHIWQSTLFMIVVGALTVLFRKNNAVVRYRLWLIASVKFLIPFSLLVGIGGLLQWHPVHTFTSAEVPVVIRQMSQPFAATPARVSMLSAPKELPVTEHSLAPLIAYVWFTGASMVLLVWFFRWIKLARTVERAEPFEDSISFAPFHGEFPRVRILASQVGLEPGVFGIVRPVLMIPENIARSLNNAQLQAIVAHEMAHVRGHDNLAAAVHTIAEALFWFHPLVWWLGNRLVDERERACDEAVLQLGHDPGDYAEGILKVCKSYVLSPACVAGISGSNLKKRIEVIMENRGVHSLTFGKKLLLLVAGAGLLAGPVFAGMMSAAQSSIGAVLEAPLPVIERVTVAALPVLSKAPTLTPAFPAQLPVNSVHSATLPVIESATIAGLPVLSQVPVPSPQPTPAPAAGQVGNEQQKWLDEVSIIITDAERKAFPKLTKDAERENFIRNFWLVRDPTPGTPANEFRDEFDRRFAYANEHFTTRSGIPGSQTDRGKMHILNGPPDEIVSHPSGGTYYRLADQGRGVTNTFPFETWRYRHIDRGGDNVIYEFVDKQKNGEYTLEYDPFRKVDSPTIR